MEFPLIMAYGASQLYTKGYAQALGVPNEEIKLFPELVAEHFNGFCINTARPGTGNSRFIRRATHDCLEQRKLNPTQRIIVLLELTFDLRKEIWNESIVPTDSVESNFQSIQLATDFNWRKKLLGNKKSTFMDKIQIFQSKSTEEEFLLKWRQGELFFYSPYAENINLLQQLITLTALFREQNIEYIIYRGNPVEHFEDEYLLDFFADHLAQDSNILDLFNFSFTKWTLDNGFDMIENNNTYNGHPGLQAHREFANLLIKKL